MKSAERSYDVLVIGSGIAGMSVALEMAEGASVCLITKRDLCDTNTSHAQGGISAVLGRHDSFESHVRDTLVAGAGLCREDIVELVVRGGPEAIAKLLTRGVAFDRDDSGDLMLTREGGHSYRRVAHSHDATGAAVQEAVAQRVRQHPNIDVREHHHAVDLITRGKLAKNHGKGVPGGQGDRVLGAYVLDVAGGSVQAFAANAVILATGGAGRTYLYTTNPDIATGDGVAMAYRAGVHIANMEFFQFHPTLLYHPSERHFLISEALRGEGGILRSADGEPFMRGYHELAELAPRDIVARAIDNELKTRGDESVFLDMTHLDAGFLSERFPNIQGTCARVGIDIATQPIPVVPAAHYMCGGVLTDDMGRTNIQGLYAVGEAACTGLHGANRLASNSLLEGAVFAVRAATAALGLLSTLDGAPDLDLPDWDTGDARSPDEAVVMNHSWDEIRRLMWNYVGIVRSTRRLKRARRRLHLLYDEVREEYWRFLLTPELIELRNLCQVARLIVDSALMRHESRGLHYSLDHPDTDDNWRHDTVLRKPMMG